MLLSGPVPTNTKAVIAPEGIVTRKGGRMPRRIGSTNAADLVRPPPVPARRHPARRLAVPALHPELPRRGGSPGRAWRRSLLRDDPALGVEVRARLRPATAARSVAPRFPLAPRRAGGSDPRLAGVSAARRRSRR